MEGPSLVIATEDLRQFLKKKVAKASGTANLPLKYLKGQVLLRARSWGKHLILDFSRVSMRIHFLMFGSYRIDNPRPNRFPKMELEIGGSKIFFYSCAIKILEGNYEKDYDWSTDLMSKKWDAKAALAKIRKKPTAEIADVLMDQAIFSGLGNIMKNEILFLLLMHPETKIEELTATRQKEVVKVSRQYSFQFYEWKKANILKRNWQIMRKKVCPRCNRKVVKKPTGKLKRLSHYCPHCQKKR